MVETITNLAVFRKFVCFLLHLRRCQEDGLVFVVADESLNCCKVFLGLAQLVPRESAVVLLKLLSSTTNKCEKCDIKYKTSISITNFLPPFKSRLAASCLNSSKDLHRLKSDLPHLRIARKHLNESEFLSVLFKVMFGNLLHFFNLLVNAH